MKRFFVNMAFFLAIVLCASVYAPLRAMDIVNDSTTAQKPKAITTYIACLSARTIPVGTPFGMGQKISQDFRGDIPAISYPSFSFAPFHAIWSNNLNSWINEVSYNISFYNAASRDMAFLALTHEISWGLGYGVVNTPRFRLYPSIAVKVVFDELRFGKTTSMTNLFSTFESSSISLQRFVAIPEIAVGADYRFSTDLDNYDVFIIAKIGYNLITADSPWTHGGRAMADASSEWFSRRGVFFQIGIGFGTKQE